MTIRRRLFWSNILMLMIPAALSALISYVILFLFTQNSPVPLEQAFPNAFEAVIRFQRTGDMADLRESVDDFNDKFGDSEVYMAVLQGNQYVYPENSGELDFVADHATILDAVFRDNATGSITINKTRLLIEQIGDYRIILFDRNPRPMHLKRPMLVHIPLILLTTLVLIFITNRLLTHLLTKRITTPLKLLANGARQLGEGNLEHRIVYRGKDEFSPVCDDFNEMAYQLQLLIAAQQKNENSRKELLAGISHDLRTPLTSIKAYVEGLLDGVAEDMASQLRYLGIIRSKAEDIDRIVDKLFLFSKLDIGDYPVSLERLDIGDELCSMEKAVEKEYSEKGLSMTLENRVEGVFVTTDAVCLHNVFMNIIENSLRYKREDHCHMTVRCFVEELSVTIWISDDGPGVEKDELERIFDVFYRGDPSRRNPSKGSGLGLAISSRMMERVGGSIHAESPLEGGLRMVLRLPRESHAARDGGEEGQG